VEINGYQFYFPTSGGKAGKGCNVTTSLQLRLGNEIKKQFRFKADSVVAREIAVAKAKRWAGAN
jgi:hypothetical protein